MHAQGISQEHSHVLLAPQPGRYMKLGDPQGAIPAGDLYALYQDHFDRLREADGQVEYVEEKVAKAKTEAWPEELPEELAAELAEELASARATRDRIAGRVRE